MPTKPALSEGELRARIRERMADGRLPAKRPSHIDAGYGTGKDCDACGVPITSAKVEYEINDARMIRFHFACFVVWQQECTRGSGGSQ
jgi:hypothetical protein